jgi:hypothetical protein
MENNNVISEITPENTSSSNTGFWIFIIIFLTIVGIVTFIYLNRRHIQKHIPVPYSSFSSFFSSVKSTTPTSSTTPQPYPSDSNITSNPSSFSNKNFNSSPNNSSSNNSSPNNSPSLSSSSELTDNKDTADHSRSNIDIYNDTTLDTALKNATKSQNQPQSDDSYSSIQASKPNGKSGWCYIGEERGFRTCLEVGKNDNCMSGDIFPSKDICVNPSLRQ